MQTTITTSSHHHAEVGDVLKLDGKVFRVTEITDHRTIKLRQAAWYDRVWYKIQQAWQWLNN